MDYSLYRQEFERVRDIPYSLPVLDLGSTATCFTKNMGLVNYFNENGLPARPMVADFYWSTFFNEMRSTNPELNGDLDRIAFHSHTDGSKHVYLEVEVDGKWYAVDASWDSGLSKILPVNQWLIGADQVLAVPVSRIYTPEESLADLNDLENLREIIDELRRNPDFYVAFNEFLKSKRV